MPGYLLDTNTVRYWFDGDSGKFPAVKAHADALSPESPLYVSAITIGEIEYGHALHPCGAGMRRDDFVAFLSRLLPQVLPVSRFTAKPYGSIRAALTDRFPPKGGWSKRRRAEELYDPTAARELGIDENDLWLVAQAVERNLVLVTTDKMTRIRDAVVTVYQSIRMENWTQLT